MTIAIGVKGMCQGTEMEFNSAEAKVRRIFKCWGEFMEKYQRTLRRRLVNVFANWHLSRLASYPPTETGRENSFLMIMFQKYGPQLLEKDISWLQKASCQRGRKVIYYCKFSEINALIKGKSGAYNQEEIYPKFSQAEGKLRPSW